MKSMSGTQKKEVLEDYFFCLFSEANTDFHVKIIARLKVSKGTKPKAIRVTKKRPLAKKICAVRFVYTEILNGISLPKKRLQFHR